MTGATDIAAFAVDGMQPERVLQPASVEALSAGLAEAHAAREAVVPWGGGTRMHVGNVPGRYTAALDLRSLSANIEHEAGDLTVVADAGVTIDELEERLRQQGQRLPFDVRNPGAATLGGSVASNAGAHMRSSFGGIRDWVIGMKVVLADGTVTKSGGRVVKNVQGYDLHRLHTGAFGTLGVIAEVALKVVPTPAASSTVAAWFKSVAEAGEFAMKVFNGPAMPEALTMFAGSAAETARASLNGVSSGDARVLVAAHITGVEAAVTRTEKELVEAGWSSGSENYEVVRDRDAGKLWASAAGAGDGHALTLKANMRPRHAIKFLESVLEGADSSEAGGELQVGFGSVTISRATADRSTVDRVRESAAQSGAQVTVERCPVELKREIDVFGDQGQALSVMRSIKKRFDPDRVLNPGRFAARI